MAKRAFKERRKRSTVHQNSTGKVVDYPHISKPKKWYVRVVRKQPLTQNRWRALQALDKFFGYPYDEEWL